MINQESHNLFGNLGKIDLGSILIIFKSPSRSSDFEKRQNKPRAIFPKLYAITIKGRFVDQCFINKMLIYSKEDYEK